MANELEKKIVENIMNDKFVESDKELKQLIDSKLKNRIDEQKESVLANQKI